MDKYNYYKDKDSVYGINPIRRQHILGLIPSNAKTIVDFGCGRGELAKDIANKNRIITGIDISSQALVKAKPFLNNYFCFDAENNNWPDKLLNNKYDCVLVTEFLEHLFQPEVFLDKIKAILKPDSVVIITTPNFLFILNRLLMLFGRFEYKDKGITDRGHIHFFTFKSLKRMLKELDYKIIKENNFYPNLFKKNSKILKILPGLFAYQIILKVKKN